MACYIYVCLCVCVCVYEHDSTHKIGMSHDLEHQSEATEFHNRSPNQTMSNRKYTHISYLLFLFLSYVCSYVVTTHKMIICIYLTHSEVNAAMKLGMGIY